MKGRSHWSETKQKLAQSCPEQSSHSLVSQHWNERSTIELNPPKKRQTKIAVFKLMMQIDNFPSNYGRSPSITGAVPGTNPWTPAKRLVANVLTLHFLNQPLLAGHLNQLTHHESHTGGRDMISVLMILLVRRQGCKMSKRSPKDINCGKKISFPKQPPLIIAAYTPVKQWKISLEENAAPVLSRFWVLQAVPALALVRLPEVNMRDQQITSPWCTMGTAL